MTIIVCIDDNCGMMFNGRRQTQDKIVYQRILDIIDDSKLYINEFSSKLFDKDCVYIEDNFLNMAKSEDFCFVENVDITDYVDKIEKIIIYKWNRIYPSDVKFNMQLINQYKLISKVDFAGNSHKIITEEVYVI